MPSSIYPTAWYTYGLCDPRTGIVFYVGKGSGKRAWQHARDVVAGRPAVNARKDAKIAEILKRGDEVEIQIFAEYDDENDALEHEFELVDSMPELTNMVPGGAGRRLRPEEIAKRVAARERRILEKAKSKWLDKFKRDRKHRFSSVTKIPGAHLHRNAIDAWVAEQGTVVIDERFLKARNVATESERSRGVVRAEVTYHPSRPPKRKRIEAELQMLRDAQNAAARNDLAVIRGQSLSLRQKQILAEGAGRAGVLNRKKYAR